MSTPTLQLNCPTCGKTIEYSERFPFRPFCSERCQLIDLGAWADESHKIAGTAAFDDVFSDDIEPNGTSGLH